MRNIVTVIDEILAVIPKYETLTSRLREGLNSIKDSAGYCPPESMYHLWHRGSDLLWEAFDGADPVDLTGWQRSVVDIWMDKKNEGTENVPNV